MKAMRYDHLHTFQQLIYLHLFIEWFHEDVSTITRKIRWKHFPKLTSEVQRLIPEHI